MSKFNAEPCEAPLKQQQKRSSSSFIYNEDQEWHIGKRTGISFGRVNPKQNFDGFPRFSEYESHGDIVSDSLAKEMEGPSSNSHTTGRVSANLKSASPSPFALKQSPVNPSPEQNLSSRLPDASLSGFGDFNISSIKRRSSAIRPSEMKSYKDLLTELESDEFKQFIFNQEEVQELLQSTKKQQVEQSENIVPVITDEDRKKKSRESKRVSFKMQPQLFPAQQEQPPESRSISKQPKRRAIKINEVLLGDGYSHGDENQKIQNKQPKKQTLQDIIKEVQLQMLAREEQERRAQDDLIKSQQQEWTQPLSEFATEQNVMKSTKQGKKDKKRSKKLRITDKPPEQELNSVKTEPVLQNKQAEEKPVKRKKKSTQSQGELSVSKEKTKSRLPQIIANKQLLEQGSAESQRSEADVRYPKRATRIKPLHYWQNQRVHYRAGKAVTLERAQVKIEEILSTTQNYEHIVTVNFHNQDLDIEINLPAKKQLHCNGIREPYRWAQISLQEDKNSRLKDESKTGVFFDDQLHNNQIAWQQSIEIPAGRYFEIDNTSKFTVVLQLKVSMHN